MNKCIVDKVQVEGHRINYKYTVEGEWTRFFKTDSWSLEYSIDISTVPTSVAVIPLLANLIPIAWISDARILVEELDKAFFNSIDCFKQGYINMHPGIDFKGEIIVRRLVDNYLQGKKDGAIALFSGGVDAFNTLVNHMFEKPTLLTLWGSDVKLSDLNGWKIVKDHLDNTAERFGIDSIWVKTEFRQFIEEGLLSAAVKKSGDEWWHGFQHGIGIISHAAPAAYVMGQKIVYIASSFTAKDKGKVTCASDPSIDNFFKFCDAKVVHDGYEFDRQGKIHNIVNYAKAQQYKIPLRVCWQSRGGTNCCKCEKCWRTILGIYAEGENPQNYGFDYDDFSQLCRSIYKKRELFYYYYESRYLPIQNRLREVYSESTVEPELKWFYSIDLASLQSRYAIKTFFKKAKRKIQRIAKKAFGLKK